MKHNIFWDFDVKTDSHNSAQKTRHRDNFLKSENLPSSGLCNPGRPQRKKKKIEKRDLDQSRDLKNLWNMRVTVLSVVTGTLGNVPRS